jgi:hypothetical protein
VKKRADLVLGEWGGSEGDLKALALGGSSSSSGGSADGSESLEGAASRKLKLGANGVEKQTTGERESHVWERGDELCVTAGALARHWAALAMIARYGPSCSLLIALLVDIVEYYRLWGNRRELMKDRWSISKLPIIALVGGGGGAASAPSAAGGAASSALLLDKLLAALRLWVPLLPLPPGPLRSALLRDLGAYIVSAWETT